MKQAIFPLRRSVTVSFIIVENVEKPPRNPVASSRRQSGLMVFAANNPATKPASRPATTLMANVESGNVLRHNALIYESQI